MRIPLDYYRILGLPIQASAEQLQQAYRDRTLQMPRREYSEAAIAARKQLLEEAYAVLSDPSQRTRYDASYFERTYDLAHDSAESTPAVDSYTPSIEISDELFVGALLILQDLGEYELVLNLGSAYLGTSSANVDSSQTSKSELVRSDIGLTVALACLELGREQWQQGQYEHAATSLEIGQELLLREGISVRGDEIQADIYKLRPYRILELLAQPKDNVAQQRRLGLKLLQDMLQQRGGIDGTGDDGSGLSIDDFLKFIQQLRSYLTVAEQQSLFEAESQRPSAVATYLVVYTLIARGFAQRMPVLIRQAKLLLMRLSKRQDLYLEQAICSLLLGQPAEASRALELSQEYEPLAFIREHSQGSPDLLPGLCLYSERWLQTEVFPHFRDLAAQQASLKDYFANNQVQAYLEALPTQVEVTHQWAKEPALVPQTASNSVRERVPTPARGIQTGLRAHNREALPTAVVADATSSQATTATMNATPASIAMPTAERVVRTTALPNSTASPNVSALARVQPSAQQSRRRARSRFARGFGFFKFGGTRFPRQGNSSILEAKKKRLLLVSGVLGIVILGFLISQTYAWLKQAFFPIPTLQGEQPLVRLDQPPLPIPDPSSELLVADEPLTQETAGQLIQSWLSTKTVAFGSTHAVDSLQQILVGPALSQWQKRVQNDLAANRYRQYKHKLKVDSVQTSEAAPDKAQVEATVNEVAQVYEDGKLNRNFSYNENLRVRYDLVRQNGQWRIQQMNVIEASG